MQAESKRDLSEEMQLVDKFSEMLFRSKDVDTSSDVLNKRTP